MMIFLSGRVRDIVESETSTTQHIITNTSRNLLFVITITFLLISNVLLILCFTTMLLSKLLHNRSDSHLLNDKSGWTRVLYSTKVKLFPWIPNFVVTFITTKALVESTTWVKREAEIEAKKSSSKPEDPLKKLLPSWMISGGSTNQSVPEKEGSKEVQKDGPRLEKTRAEPPQAKQHNFNGLLHPFFRLRSSLGGKAI